MKYLYILDVVLNWVHLECDKRDLPTYMCQLEKGMLINYICSLYELGVIASRTKYADIFRLFTKCPRSLVQIYTVSTY